MKLISMTVAGLTLAALSASALAVDAEKAIKYRRAAFQTIAWNFGPMGAMVKGEAAFDQAAFTQRAETVAFLSGLPAEGFADGTDFGDTKAKAAVWENRADFDAKMKDFQDQAANLVAVAKAGDEGAIKAQFGKTAKTCKACHKEYKED